MLAVAHRLENVPRFDRLLVMHPGELLRMKTPNDLIGEEGQLRA